MIELEIRQHTNGDDFYIAKKGNINPLYHTSLKTYHLSRRGAEAVLRTITDELEEKKKGSTKPNV